MTEEELERMSEVDIRTCNPDELVDLRSVHIDTSKPVLERMADFIVQIKNPYVFKVGDVCVKINYCKKEGAPTFQELFQKFLLDQINNSRY